METIHYILDNWDYLLTLTLQHLWLVALAVGLAIIIGVPLGILIVRHKWLATPVLGIATIVLTIPSIALFGLMIPLFSLIGQGIGALPAITAVFLYSLLPIVRNTYAGLCSVPASLLEAANGIGMTKWQRLRQVEIPNAWPVMLSGIRIATAINVGTAPLAFLIGASSYGELIFPGIYLNDFPTLILGAAATALFALILDTLLAALGRLLSPHLAR